MRILIGGDTVPTQSNEACFISGKLDEIVDNRIRDIFHNSDLCILNLEAPLTNNNSAISKTGPAIKVNPQAVNGLCSLNVGLVTLANNHILDYGEKGLEDTIRELNERKIKYVGAGNNIDEAARPVIINVCDKRIGIYGCVEHEFSIAAKNQMGANPFDPLEVYDHIIDLKEKCDYVIVLYHGGKEHYRYPSPELQKICRKFITKGANLVVCQHSHCIGCKESFENGLIIYGQGNFIFDYQDNEYWNTSLLISINDLMKIDFIPIVKKGASVRLADDAETEIIMNAFSNRSEDVKSEMIIEQKYNEYALSKRNYYLEAINGVDKSSLVYRILNRVTAGKYKYQRIQRIYNRQRINVVRNFIECEAHRELFLRALRRNEIGDN